jgi:hypothetical protein
MTFKIPTLDQHRTAVARATEARNALETAEREHGDTEKREADRATSLAAAERAYLELAPDDLDAAELAPVIERTESPAADEQVPDEIAPVIDRAGAAGAAVIKAREACMLSGLRVARTRTRVETARAAFEVAANNAAKSGAAIEVGEAAEIERTARNELAGLIVMLEHAHPAGPLEQVVQYANEREEAGRIEAEAARRALEAARAMRVEAEARLGTVDPALAEELAAERFDQERAELLGAASVDAFRASIAGDVAIVVLASTMLRSAMARVLAHVDQQHVTAAAARALGAEVPNLDRAHAAIHVLAALGEAYPEHEHRMATEIRWASSGAGTIGRGNGPGLFRDRVLANPTAIVLRAFADVVTDLQAPEAAQYDAADRELVALALSTAGDSREPIEALFERRRDAAQLARRALPPTPIPDPPHLAGSRPHSAPR